jgi:acyl CoA:acetate/3-ketoacid CoA transferase alpha subunit
MPQELSELSQEVIKNVGMPLFAQNQEMQQQMQNTEEEVQQNPQEEMQEQ